MRWPSPATMPGRAGCGSGCAITATRAGMTGRWSTGSNRSRSPRPGSTFNACSKACRSIAARTTARRRSRWPATSRGSARAKAGDRFAYARHDHVRVIARRAAPRQSPTPPPNGGRLLRLRSQCPPSGERTLGSSTRAPRSRGSVQPAIISLALRRNRDDVAEMEKLLGVLRLAVDQHLVMHVRAGGAAGAAEIADLGMRPDMLADRDGEAVEMGVAGRDAVAVIDLDDLAVIVAVAGIGHRAGGGGVDRRFVRRVEIEPGMERRAAVDRVVAHPERAADLVACERRRNRQRLDH